MVIESDIGAAASWLVSQGVWRAVVNWCVGGVLGLLVAWKPWSGHRHRQVVIADRLDTTTPGGLTEVMNLITRVSKGSGNDSSTG